MLCVFEVYEGFGITVAQAEATPEVKRQIMFQARTQSVQYCIVIINSIVVFVDVPVWYFVPA